jgi:hypothetical protein
MIALLFLTTVCPNGAVTMGVDVSQFQGTIDWSMVHGAGYDFAFIRATSGTTLADAQFATNWSNAARADASSIDAPRIDAPAADAGNGASSDSGCSCSTSRAQSPPILLLLALISGWRLRRAATRSRRR